MASLFPLTAAVFFLSVACPHLSRAAYTIGINYGTIADNLPPPSKVATFLKTKTTIDRVKIFHASPDILRAFAGTGIAVTVSVGNEDIVSLSKLPAAKSWVSANILPFYPKTLINRIAMGNEILATSDKTLIASLLPAMKALHSALQFANVTNVQVTTPNSLGILASSYPPSTGQFRSGFDRTIFAPILEFHRQTNSSFMVNPYPFFGISAETLNYTLNYALFKPIPYSTFDNATGKNYTNMFDAQMDAVYSAMKKVGYEDVEIVVGETGWPSVGDPSQLGVSMANAESYNRNLVRHVNSGKGTPLMPNRKFETYIFALFNENKKPTTSERNYGLFKPDLTPVYDVGILRNSSLGPRTQSDIGPQSVALQSLGPRTQSDFAPQSDIGPQCVAFQSVALQSVHSLSPQSASPQSASPVDELSEEVVRAKIEGVDPRRFLFFVRILSVNLKERKRREFERQPPFSFCGGSRSRLLYEVVLLAFQQHRFGGCY
ncbi:hypothetical protein EUGRSUZ_B02364 [Eucalyptus grandis]|uniref:Uncharacterized protein n=2 Tax=Eucalyptus grandis TaxID=71139 RepID=A0ACC3LT81_EUCGR|nr:hypothetical protein EUGRSUZ_B02364 [Eucalyptus grandis]